MTELVIRKIAFDIPDDVPFQWQPANPGFGIFGNIFTFIAVPFEKYIVSVMRQAQERITDPRIAQEAEAFLRQEAQHANAHRRHMQALVAQYPALEECYDDACASYDELLATKSLDFNLAYIANLEATFTPLFRVVLNHRDDLLGGGLPSVASMMAWHFVEEIEHRSSGLMVCNHVVGSSWYRLRHFRATFQHVEMLTRRIVNVFEANVPFEDRQISAHVALSKLSTLTGPRLPWHRRESAPEGPPPVLGSVSTKELATMIARLGMSQLPFHNPQHQPLPAWAGVWRRRYDEGADMAHAIGADITS